MKRIVMSCVVIFLLLTSICSADVHTTKISDLDAERFVQKYNAATFKEHGKMNYFVAPELSTPDKWKGFWPYDLWKTVSMDSKYRLEITVDKKGYVTAVDIIYLFESDIHNAKKILMQMLSTGSVMSAAQIEYLSNHGEIVINNKTAVVLMRRQQPLNICVFGRSPYD